MEQKKDELRDYTIHKEIADFIDEHGAKKAIIFLINIVREIATKTGIDKEIIRRLL